MKSILVTAAVLATSVAIARGPYDPTGRAKCFKGPEGEVLVFMPLLDGTKALVKASKTYGIRNEKALIYDLRDYPWMPSVDVKVASKDPLKKRGRMVVLSKLPGRWTYNDLLANGRSLDIPLTYSEEHCRDLDTTQLLKEASAAEDEPAT